MYGVKITALIVIKQRNYLKKKALNLKKRKLVIQNLEDLLAVVPNARTAPQIFLGEEYVGGFMELKEKFINFNTNAND